MPREAMAEALLCVFWFTLLLVERRAVVVEERLTGIGHGSLQCAEQSVNRASGWKKALFVGRFSLNRKGIPEHDVESVPFVAPSWDDLPRRPAHYAPMKT